MNRRILFALPGLHHVARGAEAAFENIARELALAGHAVTLIGAGQPRDTDPYRFLHAPVTPRHRFRRWPVFPPLRSEYRWEELSFAKSLWLLYQPSHYDLTVTCSYPFVNWVLRMKRPRPAHLFITENGDWPAHAARSEYRWFGCDGLICTNPAYYERNKKRWRSTLIPNGVDTALFSPGPGHPSRYGLPTDVPVVGMVSALIPSKHVIEGIEAVARLPDAHLLLLGDGPLRDTCDLRAAACLGPRYHRLTVTPDVMPDLYRCMSLLLHLSRDEPFGNIYIEAAASGLPVVAHRYDVTEWIFENTATLVDTSRPDQIEQALRQALGHTRPGDPHERHQVMARRFAWPVIARHYTAFIEQVLEDRTS